MITKSSSTASEKPMTMKTKLILLTATALAVACSALLAGGCAKYEKPKTEDVEYRGSASPGTTVNATSMTQTANVGKPANSDSKT